MNRLLDEKIFNAFMLVSIDNNDKAFLCDENICKTLDVNDHLIKKYGYTMNPDGIIKVAENAAWDDVLDKVSSFCYYGGADHAKSMYTPKKARTIDEYTFRFHQMLHYWSTYGVELIEGTEVSMGWLPESGFDEAPDFKPDEKLRDARVFEVIFEDEKPEKVYKKIALRKNRCTIDEKDILSGIIPDVDKEVLVNTTIAFKENIFPVFKYVFEKYNKEDRAEVLSSICSNTNDALRGIRMILSSHRWNLKNSEKKVFVKVLESYQPADFKANIMRSREERENVLAILKHLDFNTFSRSEAHKELVSELRTGELKSWEGYLKDAIAKGNKQKVAKMMMSRPGVALRSVNYLLKNDFNEDEIVEILSANAEKLSTQTLVENFSSIDNAKRESISSNKDALLSIMKRALESNLATKTTPLKDKKVFINEGEFSFEDSKIAFNSKAGTSDYISSGLAMRINLANTRFIRIFTYWEDAKNTNSRGHTQRNRVDIDLHAALVKDGTVENVGWYAHHNKDSVYHSGDITHSHPYGCEFIDIDLDTCDADRVTMSIVNFTRQKFSEVRNLMVGIVPVSKLGVADNKKLYNGKNAFFCHKLDYDMTGMRYGDVDLKKKVVTFLGTPVDGNIVRGAADKLSNPLSLKEYTDMLLKVQNATLVDNPEDADVVLTLTKASKENEVSLIDENYFADYH